jgi:hypothetical protein
MIDSASLYGKRPVCLWGGNQFRRALMFLHHVKKKGDALWASPLIPLL